MIAFNDQSVCIRTDAQHPIVRGWLRYYGLFYRTKLYALCKRINTYLVRWARKK
ncbi:group II intron maturase-specific domain-containing protein, partial [Candidatus Mycobacterium methanotrophicum]